MCMYVYISMIGSTCSSSRRYLKIEMRPVIVPTATSSSPSPSKSSRHMAPSSTAPSSSATTQQHKRICLESSNDPIPQNVSNARGSWSQRRSQKWPKKKTVAASVPLSRERAAVGRGHRGEKSLKMWRNEAGFRHAISVCVTVCA